jgi:hypothetical protein
MDIEDLLPPFQVGEREFNFSVQPTRPHQASLDNIRTIGGHEYLNVSPWVKAVEFRSNLQYGLLDFVVAALIVATVTSTTNGVDLIKEDNACPFGPCHGE